MALALARSFLRHNTDGQISFTIVTDRPEAERPADLHVVKWVRVGTKEFGEGFTPKLYLDRLAPAPHSLFIDADCLVVKSLVPAFEALKGLPVGVLGRPIADGEWFGDIAAICKRLGIAAMPRFNGGIYYLEPGEACSAIYETARGLLPQYDAIGFQRLRARENDEVLMSAALEIHSVPPLLEDGAIMHTAMEAPGGLWLDALSGGSRLLNPRSHPQHFDWMPLEVMEPAIVHFLGADPAYHPYRTEIEALNLVSRGFPQWAARLIATLSSAWPWLVTDALRRTFRPVYHKVFGVRRVKASVR
jgi:hypothetical protein